METNIASQTKDEKNIFSNYSGESDIQRFYSGKTLFITGGTGYMGRSLVEKLLRSCYDVKRIYLLIRKKRNVDARERLDKYFDDDLFDTLRETGKDLKSKIRMIEGDLMQDEVFSSKTDRDALIEEVNIIFHVGSNVKFFEKLGRALRGNVLGTQSMLDFAKQCNHIEAFMYVSTAYSHCPRKNIMEVAYPSPASMKLVKEFIAADSASPTGLTGAALSDILGEFPNTYVFTKAIAEGLVDDAGKRASFPCVIHRPSIVMPSWREPVSGWCGNLNGPSFIFAGFSLGIFHVGIGGDVRFDVVPVDMAVNGMLVSIWDAVKNRQRESGALVYNYGSSVGNPITIKQGLKISSLPGDRIPTPSIHTIWKPFIYFTTRTWHFVILHTLFHVLPAIIVDSYLLVTGKKARALPAIKTATKSYSILAYFSLREWKIDIMETNKAIDRMSTIDCELFFCDIRKLEWRDYFSMYWRGIRIYALKDPMTTLPAAERKVRILTAIHYTGKYLILLLLAYVTLRFLGFL